MSVKSSLQQTTHSKIAEGKTMPTEAVCTEGLKGYELRKVYRRDRQELGRRATAALVARHRCEMSEREFVELKEVYDAELDLLRPLCQRPRSDEEQSSGEPDQSFDFES